MRTLLAFLTIGFLFISHVASSDEKSDAEILRVLPTQAPMKGEYLKGFGIVEKKGKRTFHEGVDISAPAGTEVRAAGPWTVRSISGKPGMIRLTLDHGQRVVTLYTHLQTTSVKPGAKVDRGAVLGTIGKKPLYYQVLVDEMPVDPISYYLPEKD